VPPGARCWGSDTWSSTEMEERTVLHADMDAFFATVEQLLQPELRGRPVVVGELSSQRGVVSAASYEARPSGIRAGMPLWEARQRCPEAVFLPGNLPAYTEYALRALRLYQAFTPELEPFSIDEAFLDVTSSLRLFGSGEAIARELKARVRDELGLTLSVGVAPNKLVAKMCCRWGKPDGLTVVPQSALPESLWARPVQDLWGVGPSTAQSLLRLGVRTIGDLAALPRRLLESEFGSAGRRLHEAAHGIDREAVHPYYRFRPAQQMGHEVTLERDTRDDQVLRLTALSLADRVARRLRRDGYQTRRVAVRVRFSDFSAQSSSTDLGEYTDLEDVLLAHAWPLLARLRDERRRVRAIGLSAGSLRVAAGGSQLCLFDRDIEQMTRLAAARDRIAGRFGEGVLLRASLLRVTDRANGDVDPTAPVDSQKLLDRTLAASAALDSLPAPMAVT